MPTAVPVGQTEGPQASQGNPETNFSKSAQNGARLPSLTCWESAGAAQIAKTATDTAASALDRVILRPGGCRLRRLSPYRERR